MKSLKGLIAGGFLALALLPGQALATGIELSLGIWNQLPGGDISYKGTTGTDSLNLKNNLNYRDQNKISGRVRIDTPLLFPNLYLMATPLGFSATGSKSTPFTFGGVSFAANVPITSELKLDHYDIGLYYGLPALKTLTAGLVNVDLGIDARIIDFKARVTGRDTLTSQIVTESKEMVIPMPMLYAAVQVKPLKWIAAEGEVRGILYENSHYYDLIGRVKLKPVGPLFAAAGYRYEQIKLDFEDVKGKAHFGGPFGEIGLEF